MISAIQNLIDYLNPTNAHRIANLSPYDPFAIFGFILLALIVPISAILLTVVARRSVYSVMDRVQHEGIYRRLRRSSKKVQRVTPLLPTVRPEEASVDRSSQAVFEGRNKTEEEGGGGRRKRISFSDVAPGHSEPEQQQQAPMPSSATANPFTSAEKGTHEHRAKKPPQTGPTRTPPNQPTQHPFNASTSPYIPEESAAAETQPLSSTPPTGHTPSEPTQRPPAFSSSHHISGAPAATKKLPGPAFKIAPTNPSRSPIEHTFEELYDQWKAARRAPQIDLAVEEDPEAKSEWFVELQAELRGAGLRAKLGG